MSARVAVVSWTASMQGDGSSNQDRVFVLRESAMVLDGASSQEKELRDGGWHADTLGDLLAGKVGASQDLPDALRSAISDVTQQLGGERPSSAVGIARWGTDAVNVLVLGDVTVVVYMSGDRDPIVIHDDRMEAIAPEIRRSYRERLERGGGFDAMHQRHVAALQAAQLRKRNKPGGYWIAEADPVAADHAITRSFPSGCVSALLLATDGVANAVTRYQIFDWAEVRSLVTNDAGGARRLLETIWQAEQADLHGQRWPRSKCHDDKAIALLEFDGRASHAI